MVVTAMAELTAVAEVSGAVVTAVAEVSGPVATAVAEVSGLVVTAVAEVSEAVVIVVVEEMEVIVVISVSKDFAMAAGEITCSLELWRFLKNLIPMAESTTVTSTVS